MPSHLQIGDLVPKAGDKDDKRPVIGLHHHPGSLGAAHVEGGGAAAVRTLHTAASIPFPPLLTEDALLQRREHVFCARQPTPTSSCFPSQVHKTK